METKNASLFSVSPSKGFQSNLVDRWQKDVDAGKGLTNKPANENDTGRLVKERKKSLHEGRKPNWKAA